MKLTPIAIMLLASVSVFAQDSNLTIEGLEAKLKPLKSSIQTLNATNSSLKSEIGSLNLKLNTAKATIDSLERRIEANSIAISETADQLGLKISNTEAATNKKIQDVDQLLSKNSLYGIIGVLSAILFSGFLYLWLSKKQKTDKTDIFEQLSKTKSSIEESLVKEFGKQTELMEGQLQLIQQQKATIQSTSNVESDHSLALKVADQITIIERSVSLMDEKTKGLQRIKNSVTNLRDNLAVNGYEIPELLGKQFHQGMNIIVASSIPDENLNKNEEIITRIIKPQVNYNEKMIQAAQVEVSVGF